MKTKLLIFAGLLLALILGTFISPLASPFPDGLEKVAEVKGFIDTAASEPVWKFSPAPDYEISSIKSPYVRTAASGFMGVILTAVISYGLFKTLSRMKHQGNQNDR